MKKYLLFICLGISILLNLVLIVVLFTRSPAVSEPAVAETTKSSDDMFTFRNSMGNLSTISKMDFNNDDIDELIYWPRSSSWYSTVSILNDELKPFCNNCEFAVYSNGINFEDLSQVKDGLIEVQVGDLDSLGEGYDPSHTIKSTTYTLLSGDFVEMLAQ